MESKREGKLDKVHDIDDDGAQNTSRKRSDQPQAKSFNDKHGKDLSR